MSMLKEFKDFAVKGNVVDMAIGVIIGTAFGRIVTSLVNDVVMPPIGVLIGNMDFSELSWVLKQGSDAAKNVTLNYGVFLNTVINFTIVAFSMFMVIQALNRLKRKQPAAPPAPSEKNCPQCLMLIPIAAKRCGHCTSALAG